MDRGTIGKWHLVKQGYVALMISKRGLEKLINLSFFLPKCFHCSNPLEATKQYLPLTPAAAEPTNPQDIRTQSPFILRRRGRRCGEALPGA